MGVSRLWARPTSLTGSVRKSQTPCVTNFHLWVSASSPVKGNGPVRWFSGVLSALHATEDSGSLRTPALRNLSPTSAYVYFEHIRFLVHNGLLVTARERIFVLWGRGRGE